GWGTLPNDARCDQGPTCTVSIGGADRGVSATYQPAGHLLTATAGPGTIEVSPVADGVPAQCKVDGQQLVVGDCDYRYRNGTRMTLRRTLDPDGLYWVGACEGNRGGLLDAPTCSIRPQGNEVVGAGYEEVTQIPPPLGSGINIVVRGTKRGWVTGSVDRGYG